MTTRRALLVFAAAAVAAAATPISAEHTCCNFDHELNLHALDCPDCLALTCDDCDAGPGERCHFGCSSYWR
jgi:hypothetical protein